MFLAVLLAVDKGETKRVNTCEDGWGYIDLRDVLCQHLLKINHA